MEEYRKDNSLKVIADQIIEEHEELNHIKRCRVGYQWSSKANKKGPMITYGDCTKISDKFKEFMPYDFIITLYEPNVSEMNEMQLKILIYHELLHIGYEDERFFLNPHDIEDFETIINNYGLHWEVT